MKRQPLIFKLAQHANFIFGVIAPESASLDLPVIGQRLVSLFSEVEETIQEHDKSVHFLSSYKSVPYSSLNRCSDDAATPVTKILEPQTKYIISKGRYTSTSQSGFTSQSEHLLNAKQMLLRCAMSLVCLQRPDLL